MNLDYATSVILNRPHDPLSGTPTFLISGILLSSDFVYNFLAPTLPSHSQASFPPFGP
jgi:hypothetical protein